MTSTMPGRYVVDPARGERPFRRPISPVEWWIAAHPDDTTPVLQIVIEGSGRLELQQLRAAVRAASDACPGTRLTRDDRTWIDAGIPPAVRLVEAATPTIPRSVPAVGELHDPLSADGATCEVLLVAGADSVVVLRASHAVMDAHGVLIWARDVFRALRGEALTGAPDTVTEADLLPETEPGVQTEPPGLDYPALLGARRPSATRQTFWRRRTIDGYHPALVAKLAGIIAADCGADQARVTVPVNLRRQDPSVRSTASLSLGVQLDVPVGQPWERTHQELLGMLAEHRENDGRLPPAVLEVPMQALRAINVGLQDQAIETNRYAAHASLAHLGRLELADFNGPGFRAGALYSLSMAPIGGPLELDAIECGGHTELTVSWHDGPRTAMQAERLLDRIEEQLSPLARRSWPGNDTERPMPQATTVVQLFAAQAAATPDAVAVSGPDGELTYRELDHRSRTVAHALRSRGIGREQTVGVFADRSAAAVVAIWGIVRAGAAYLPLDVGLPDSRVTELLAGTEAAACLIEEPYDQRSVLPAGCDPIVLDDLAYSATVDWTESAVAPADLAYVIYTSGSTGRPKGVEIEHRALHNYVVWATRDLGIDHTTRMPLLTSLSFDVSCTSVFVPLLAGGVLLLPSGELNHAVLRELLLSAKANVLSLTPSLLELVCELDVRPDGMRAILSAGELLRRTAALRAQAMFGPDCLILNSYGPTETTIECTSHPFDAERDTAPGVPIGLPSDNCTAYLLDGHGRFTAAGELGELYLGGTQLARGYRGRPDLTEAVFRHLADGSRVYRTGDIARELPSGELEFIARVDDQVKVLGHRIEPAEISQVLEEHPTVTRAAVIARTRDGQAHKALCAYVIASPAVDPAELHEYLVRRLPRYMVPATITVVADIPQTGNSKIDPGSLPDPFAGGGSSADRGPATGTPVADGDGAAVAAIWASTLGVDAAALSADADFHQLGGNSLLMLSMVAGICREVVGPAAEGRFMARLGELLLEPTLARVTELAREARDGADDVSNLGRAVSVVPG